MKSNEQKKIVKKMQDYHINIFILPKRPCQPAWHGRLGSNEDQGYIADIPDLGYCSAFGETPESALCEVLKAKEAWLKSAKSNGKEIPLASYRPLIYQIA